MATQRERTNKIQMRNIARINEELNAIPEKIFENDNKIRSVSVKR